MDVVLHLVVSLMAASLLAADPSSTVPLVQQHFAVLGQNVSLTCSLDPNVKHVVWTHGNETVINYRQANSLKSFFRVSPNKTLEIDLLQSQANLTILHAKYNDAGNYSCEQYFEAGTSKASRFYLQLQGYPRLSIKTKTSTGSYYVGADCCVGVSWNAKEIFIIWAQEDIIIRKGIPKPTGQKNGFIDYCDHVNVRSSHNIYGEILSCLVPNKYNLSSWVQIIVKYPATVKILTSTSVKIGKDDDFVISCNSDGHPPAEPKLEKKIDNTWSILPINATAYSNFSTNNITWKFSLAKAKERVDGLYRCTAYNGIGTQSFTENVKVVYEDPIKIAFVAALAVLVFPLTIIIAVLIRKYKKNRSNRYEWYLDVPRYTRRVSDTLRTLARSFRQFGESGNLSDVYFNSATSGEGTKTGEIAEVVQNTNTSNATTSSIMESGNIYYQDNGEGGSDLESQGEEEFLSNSQENEDDRISQVYVNCSVLQKHKRVNAEEENTSQYSEKDGPLAIEEKEGKPRPTSETSTLYATIAKTENMEQFTTM